MDPEEIMYEVLKYINRESQEPPAHSETFLKALETLGYIKKDWDKTYLTEAGKNNLNRLSRKFETW